MGAIEDVYADLDTDVSEAEFREAVEQKVEQMGGLADEETAAMLIAHELQEGEVDTVADVEPGMDEVKFLAKVLSIGDLRTFEREDADEDGRVVNVEAGDETGTVRLAFWDEQAQSVTDGDLEVGQVLRVKGRPKDGYNGVEVSVEKAEPDDDVEIDVQPGDTATIESLSMGQSDVDVRGIVLDTDEVRTFDRDDGSEGRVSNLLLGDETGRIRVTMWDDRADRATELDSGAAVEVVDGYVRERDGDLELHVGDHGAIEAVEEAVDFVPDTKPIGDLELGETADIGGVVRSTDPKRTFDRDDGSEGQVRNVRIQDDSGDVRVALWGPKADTDVAPGDEVFIAAAEIQDGWQDDIEASAGWRATVVVLDDSTADAGDAGGDADATTGLGAFANGDRNATGDDGATGDAAGNENTSGERGASSGGSATVGATAAGDVVEFTGTVVQTGSPAIVDDGQETVTVETDESLQLGQEVTVRGTMREDVLDAEDVF
ncbi:MAG: single-stranded DNA binding protein [Haloarculaceae archaeon]